MSITNVKSALTIAGSDSSGGAGIQADLKTFSAYQVFGKSVISSITSQNSMGVEATDAIAEDVVDRQLQAIFADTKPEAVKTGMLANDAIVETVAKALKRNRIKNLIVDPVIRSSSGKSLLSAKGVKALKERLLPLALCVTPNIKEAEVLSGLRIKAPADRLKAAKAILKLGVKSVLITGGHLRGEPEDFFYDGGRPWLLSSPRLVGEDIHGTGCVLSAAITAGLAGGKKIKDAIEDAKAFISDAILGRVQAGEGMACVDPMASLHQDRERLELLHRVTVAIDELKKAKIGDLIPEVQANLAVGLKAARGYQDVVGIPGRIIKLGSDIVTLSPPQFAGSRHVADIVLTAMAHDPSKRAVMNIKYTDELIKICKRLKFTIGAFDRAKEPKRVKELEGSSLEWGTDTAIKKSGFVPDIIFDLGGVGKEEMIRVIADDIDSLVEKILKIHRATSGG
jgi:hydroxymethylpyrimidine/phosphomethylpyrimidine kinase